jgi:hypothetical protein
MVRELQELLDSIPADKNERTLSCPPLRSRLMQTVLPPDLVDRLRQLCRCVVYEKLITQHRSMCISGPMGNAPRAEVLLNTKLAVQYSKQTKNESELTARPCAACRRGHGEVAGSRPECCEMGEGGCQLCVRQNFWCPDCGVQYARRWAYETGSGQVSVGRNPAQFRILPFTEDMDEMVARWTASTGHEYNNIVLVTYCGASMCAHHACGLTGKAHGSIRCGTVLAMHQDNGQGGGAANSQATQSVNRTLNVGAPRTLTMALQKHLPHSCGRPVSHPEVSFEMCDGTEFILDTRDEVEELRETGEGITQCSWEHGMIDPICEHSISCGYVGRNITKVRDVNLATDVVISPHSNGGNSERRAEFETGVCEWHAMCGSYARVVHPRVEAALKAWDGYIRARTRGK